MYDLEASRAAKN